MATWSTALALFPMARRKELVEAGNHADVAIYTTEKSLTEAEGHVAADVKAANVTHLQRRGEVCSRDVTASNCAHEISLRIRRYAACHFTKKSLTDWLSNARRLSPCRVARCSRRMEK